MRKHLASTGVGLDYLQYTFREGYGLTILHIIIAGFKLTIVTNVSFSECLAISNVSHCCYIKGEEENKYSI